MLLPNKSTWLEQNTLLVLHQLIVSLYLHFISSSMFINISISTWYIYIYLKLLYNLLIFIAGGTVYWSISTKWYRGSAGRNPKLAAVLTITIPINGLKMNRTQTTAIIVDGFTSAFLNPVRVSEFRMSIYIYIYTCTYNIVTELVLPCVRLPPSIRVMHGMVPSLIGKKTNM